MFAADGEFGVLLLADYLTVVPGGHTGCCSGSLPRFRHGVVLQEHSARQCQTPGPGLLPLRRVGVQARSQIATDTGT